jgi:transglutaminase-like putative cysteine protease
MTVASRYHAWSTITAITAAVLVTLAAEAPLLGLTTIPLLALSWAMFRRTGRSPVPRWLTNAMVIAATLNLARQLIAPDHRAEDSIARLSEFLIVLLTVKMLENRRVRDQIQAIALSGMAAIGATLTSVSLTVAGLTTLYLLAAINTVVLFQFARNDALARGTDFLWRQDDPDASSATDFLAPLRWTMLASIPALAVGAITIFLLMPRDLGKQMLGNWNTNSGNATAGFNDEVQLGFDGVISVSDDIVMEVTLEINGRTTILVEPQYLRGAVLDHYDHERGKWMRSLSAAEHDRRGATRFAPSSSAAADGPRGLIHQRVKIRNRTTDHLFALLSPVLGQTTNRVRIAPNEIDATIRFDGARGPMRYSVASNPLAPETRITEKDTTDPFLTGPVRDYAAEVLRRRGLERDPELLSDPEDPRRIEVFRQHLSNLFRYTLEVEAPPPGRDPIEWFLLEGRRGTCEYFASALAAMCRSVGIEARVITGYMTNEADETSGSYIVRSRHAHAWVEALVPMHRDELPNVPDTAPRLRWLTYDATPLAEAARDMGHAADLLARIRRTFERLESAWLNVVIAYDGSRQAEVLGPSLGPTGWIGALGDRLAAVRTSWVSRAVSTAAAFAVGFTLVATSLTVVRFLILRRRAPRSGAPAAHRTPEARAATRTLARLDRAFRRAGLPRPAWSAPLDHADALAARHPAPGAIAHRIARACYAVRFGGADPTSLAPARADLRLLTTQLAASRRQARPKAR